jgi:hypothetical protein
VMHGRAATMSLPDLGLGLDLRLDLRPLEKGLVETGAFGRRVSKISHGAGRSRRLRAPASRCGAAASYVATAPGTWPVPGARPPARL